jgi:hypothetical protein
MIDPTDNDTDRPYLPQPESFDHIRLPERLVELIETLAEYNHDVWAAQRLREGWTYGPSRDDRNKLHPCLRPYKELPENEKEYDRLSAVASIKLVLSIGFRIEKNEP